jgi:hypothetical protein
MSVKQSNWLFGLLILGVVIISVLTTSCAQTCQRIKADGSLIGTVSGPWVVIKQSGGVITDVFKLDDALVKSETGSDGWLFLDTNGNPVHIGGDMKAIRCNNEKSAVFEQYVEFHMDIDLCTYKEKVEKVKGLTPTARLIYEIEKPTPSWMDIKSDVIPTR